MHSTIFLVKKLFLIKKFIILKNLLSYKKSLGLESFTMLAISSSDSLKLMGVTIIPNLEVA